MHQLGEGTEGKILHHAQLRRHARLLAQTRRRSLTHIIIQPNSLSLSLLVLWPGQAHESSIDASINLVTGLIDCARHAANLDLFFFFNGHLDLFLFFSLMEFCL
ncbi:unnamed protein product [Linum tenue]|uniref:Uncharacterized protein n=1 Tax=Linum tenue TaxID=586396 RepID=A0AAV0ND69_9ROSI|nr:unnamed protein product [Linum tenue]